MTIAAIYDVPAPAKLNLFLHVVGRRGDGMHLIESLMVLIDWCDTLHVEPRADGALHRHDSLAGLPADDLCLRAARALQSASGTRLGADITLDKQVPWGAGLGGGSSDAASTLLALNRLWRLDWPLERLLPLGLALGADVPFFLAGGNAFADRHRRAPGAGRGRSRPGSPSSNRLRRWPLPRSSPAPRSRSGSPLLESRAFPKQFRASTSSPGGSGKPGLDLPKASERTTSRLRPRGFAPMSSARRPPFREPSATAA